MPHESVEKENKYVTWQVFIWAAAIIVVLMGALWRIQQNATDTLNEIKVDVGSIKADMSWVKQALGKPVATNQ